MLTVSENTILFAVSRILIVHAYSYFIISLQQLISDNFDVSLLRLPPDICQRYPWLQCGSIDAASKGSKMTSNTY